MSIFASSSFLQTALLADAMVSGATGLLLAFGADPLALWLGLPAALLRGAGLSLLPFAALLVLLARRRSPARMPVWAVIAYNALWSVDSLWLLASGWVAPTPLGYAFVVAQALAVALLAGWQYLGLRREPVVA